MVFYRIHHGFDDLTQHSQAVGLGRIQQALIHGAPGLDVQQVGKTVRLVAVHHDLGSIDSVRYLFFLENVLGHLGERNGDESVQLRLVLIFFAYSLRQADAAGADIQSHRGIVYFLAISHDGCSLALDPVLSAANISLYFFFRIALYWDTEMPREAACVCIWSSARAKPCQRRTPVAC